MAKGAWGCWIHPELTCWLENTKKDYTPFFFFSLCCNLGKGTAFLFVTSCGVSVARSGWVPLAPSLCPRDASRDRRACLMESHWLARFQNPFCPTLMKITRKGEFLPLTQDEKSFWKAELDGYALVRAGKQRITLGWVTIGLPLDAI